MSVGANDTRDASEVNTTRPRPSRAWFEASSLFKDALAVDLVDTGAHAQESRGRSVQPRLAQRLFLVEKL